MVRLERYKGCAEMGNSLKVAERSLLQQHCNGDGLMDVSDS